MSDKTDKKPVGRPKKRSMAGTAAMSNPGRPPKVNITDASYSTKVRRAHEIAEKFDIGIIQLALKFANRNQAIQSNVDSTENSENLPVEHSDESGFAFFLEGDFSKAQWERLVKDSKKRSADIYPSFYKLNSVKSQCRPTVYGVQNETCVCVSFQSMLDLSVERLLDAVGSEWLPNELNGLTLIGAYGFDSSSGFRNPHQKFEDKSNTTLKSELSLFASTFVISGLKNSSKGIMWLNPTPQSIRFCRPLRIAVEKETAETTLAEYTRLKLEVEQLRPHQFSLSNGKPATVNFDVRLSMIDGKCLNAVLENNATTRCPVCRLTMNNFNTKEDWKSIVPASNLQHGIANLHCEIKTMELLLKLSIRKPLGAWTVTKELKHITEARMDLLKPRLFAEFSVRVGEVQQGVGTSLNGNTARTCLKNPSALARVLELNEELVKRLAYILLAFRQKNDVDMDKLQSYCTQTYKLYFTTYTWAKMNPSVHKMLRHGVDIAKQFPLSLAYFAEDAAESMHKCYRKNSINHARQNSRANRLLDVFNRSVDLSDPLISLIYVEDRVKHVKDALPSEFVELFGIK